jgi:hypothetical protein
VEGPRTDAKAAPEEETSYNTEDNLVAARPGSGKIRSFEQPYILSVIKTPVTS